MTRATAAAGRRTDVRTPPRSTPKPPPRRASAQLTRACELLRSASSVVLLAHINPDADALGSALALGLALRNSGAEVTVAFADPVEVPVSLRNLPGQELIRPASDVPDEPDLVVTLDVNSPQRLGSLVSLLQTAGHSLVVDHHASNGGFGDDQLIDDAAESTTVLVAALLDGLGLPFDHDIAANLYAGLATDSVGFRHASPFAHRLCARLLEVGVEPTELMRPITDLHPFAWLGMLSAVLAAAALDPDAAGGLGLVHTVITAEAAMGIRPEELDSVIDIVRSASEAEVAAVFKELEPDSWQVSLRSRCLVDVAAIAGLLGGGGHVRAAGFGFQGSAADALTLLKNALVGRVPPASLGA